MEARASHRLGGTLPAEPHPSLPLSATGSWKTLSGKKVKTKFLNPTHRSRFSELRDTESCKLQNFKRKQPGRAVPTGAPCAGAAQMEWLWAGGKGQMRPFPRSQLPSQLPIVSHPLPPQRPSVISVRPRLQREPGRARGPLRPPCVGPTGSIRVGESSVIYSGLSVFSACLLVLKCSQTDSKSS